MLWKKCLALALCLVLLTGCAELDAWLEETEETEAPWWEISEETEDPWWDEPTKPEAADREWAIYWYLCGSDLESEYGAATEDLEEMLAVTLPEEVEVVIQTGGAWYWENDFVDDSRTERYVYSGDTLTQVDSLDMANMGDPETLASFLEFCEANHPAQHTALILWNHGGGSVSGVAFDENYDYDSLTLNELSDALFSLDLRLDVLGFDACLMATVDTAQMAVPHARYLVASEEMEPGVGWNYTGFLEALAQDPTMDGEALGRVMCDTYMDGCMEDWSEDEATLSLVDLDGMDDLLRAYENFGIEALNLALEDPGFFARFGRQAERSENYGGNTRDQGYSNLVDLGHLAENCLDLLPDTAGSVLDALENCVLYQVQGPYRDHATGLSCYYSYNGDLDDLYGYTEAACSESFQYLFSYGLEGELSTEGMEYVSTMGYSQDLLEVPDLESSGEEEYPVYVTDDGNAILELDQDTLHFLKGVYFELAYVDFEEDIMLLLGQDNDLYADWESGMFMDNFRGVWGAIDGNLVYMEVYYEADEYTAYSVPILLNGEEYSLHVVYDYEDQAYSILGARKGLDDTGMADKNLVQLRPGDEVTTVHYAATISGDDALTMVPVDTFTVTEDTSFQEEDLGDGMFVMMFELVDAKNQTALSQMILFEVEGDVAEVSVLD